MARKIGNETVMELGGGHGHRGTRNGAPAQETANARVQVIGPFRHANTAIDLSASAMTLGGVDADAPTQMLAHSAGKVLGLIYQFNALVSAGGAAAAVIQPTVAPAGVVASAAVAGNVVNVASAASGNPQNGVPDQTNEISFSKGDGLGVVLSTSHTFAPTTDDLAVFLVVRWAPSPGSPA
jgi:hypothetical protein